MKCFSLFSGIGGFDLALQNLGHEIVGACEIDDRAREVYARHFPGIKLYKDARDINPYDLPYFDLLVAGFPCQSFAYAGHRRGFTDSRGTLFFEIIRIAKVKKPKYLLLENVPGLLSNDDSRTFETILKSLDELGYNVKWRSLNSADYVPQERKRVYIMAHLREESNEVQAQCSH